MIFFLAFLLSWFCGFFVILLIAFFSYGYFSVVDITSFAVFLLGGCLLLIPVFYLPGLNLIRKITRSSKQLIYFPASLVFLANLPVYTIIWSKVNDLYGKSEALLFTCGFITTGIVFGVLWAWKNKK